MVSPVLSSVIVVVAINVDKYRGLPIARVLPAPVHDPNSTFFLFPSLNFKIGCRFECAN